MMLTRVLSASGLIVLTAGLVSAQDVTRQRVIHQKNFWTAERLQQARPMALPQSHVTATMTSEQAVELLGQTSTVGAEAEGPTVPRHLVPSVKLFEPLAAADEDAEFLLVVPQDNGFASPAYSNQPLVPRSAVTTFPYRAAGRLFFNTPQGQSWCSASVIRRRLVITAGHCVHPGSGANAPFYTNFAFVPAYDNGNAPFGTWTAAFVVTTTAWSTGGGAVPNRGDFALLEMNDQTINGVARTIGAVTGMLGYQLYSLAHNHVHMLGYPGNYDGGNRMRQVTSTAFAATTSNTVEYPSNSRGGSSGGPWIQNFAGDCTGTNCGLNPAATRVVAVTSYGPVSTTLQFQGASILDSQFQAILSNACAHKAGNC